jgi:hypothetical protein
LLCSVASVHGRRAPRRGSTCGAGFAEVSWRNLWHQKSDHGNVKRGEPKENGRFPREIGHLHLSISRSSYGRAITPENQCLEFASRHGPSKVNKNRSYSRSSTFTPQLRYHCPIASAFKCESGRGDPPPPSCRPESVPRHRQEKKGVSGPLQSGPPRPSYPEARR